MHFVSFLCDFSLQRAYCLTEVHLDFPVWLEDSRSPSTVGHAARLSLRLIFIRTFGLRVGVKAVAIPG